MRQPNFVFLGVVYVRAMEDPTNRHSQTLFLSSIENQYGTRKTKSFIVRFRLISSTRL